MKDSFKGFFKKVVKHEEEDNTSKEAAKERLHLVLMQDRVNVSIEYLELMKRDIINVVKKYVDVDENAIDVKLMTKQDDDSDKVTPILYANIPIENINSDMLYSSDAKKKNYINSAGNTIASEKTKEQIRARSTKKE